MDVLTMIDKALEYEHIAECTMAKTEIVSAAVIIYGHLIGEDIDSCYDEALERVTVTIAHRTGNISIAADSPEAAFFDMLKGMRRIAND